MGYRRSSRPSSHKESVCGAASRLSNAITTHSTEPIPICFNTFRSRALWSYGDKQFLLDKDYTLKPKDVLFGPKGARDICHAGNERLRILAEMHRHRYNQATTKKGKTTIIKAIVQIIRETGGGFVRYNNGVWYDVGDDKARDKVGHILRRLLSTSHQDPCLPPTSHQDPNQQKKLPVSFAGSKPVATMDAVSDKNDMSKISQALLKPRNRKNFLKQAATNKAGPNRSENDDGSVSSVRRGSDSVDNDIDTPSPTSEIATREPTAQDNVSISPRKDRFAEMDIGTEPLILPERDKSSTVSTAHCYKKLTNSNNAFNLESNFAPQVPPETPTPCFNEQKNASFNILVAVANRESERRREIMHSDSTAAPGFKG